MTPPQKLRVMPQLPAMAALKLAARCMSNTV